MSGVLVLPLPPKCLCVTAESLPVVRHLLFFLWLHRGDVGSVVPLSFCDQSIRLPKTLGFKTNVSFLWWLYLFPAVNVSFKVSLRPPVVCRRSESFMKGVDNEDQGCGGCAGCFVSTHFDLLKKQAQMVSKCFLPSTNSPLISVLVNTHFASRASKATFLFVLVFTEEMKQNQSTSEVLTWCSWGQPAEPWSEQVPSWVA